MVGKEFWGWGLGCIFMCVKWSGLGVGDDGGVVVFGVVIGIVVEFVIK